MFLDIFSAGTFAPCEGKIKVKSEAACDGPQQLGADDRRRLEILMRSAILIG